MSYQNLPGKIKIKITITLTIGFISFILSSILIGIYIAKPKHRDILEFIVTTFASSAGVTGAFYVGQTIKLNAESNKIDRTIECINRWNDPNFFDAKKNTDKIYDLVKGKSDSEYAKIVRQELDENLDLRRDIIEILNFLEQLSIYIDEQLVEENLLHEFFVDIVVKYGKTFKLWIVERRNEAGTDRIYEHFTAIYDKWKQP
ncbi:MAG: DUF4760 domain-containing protein [Xenococcaceae cyanobacterium]